MGNHTFSNPVIYADVPDMDIIRVGDVYYMASTTMHLSPGCPIMRSMDLVHWEIVNYVYDILGTEDAMALRNGASMYGAGQWAASLQYHNGMYYVAFASNTTDQTYIYVTDDIENGSWKRTVLDEKYHDLTLFFDDDNGRVYSVYGGREIKYAELKPDLSGALEGGKQGTLFKTDEPGECITVGENHLGYEGTHVMKKDGYYYVFNICWPKGKERIEVCHRSMTFPGGAWESRVILDAQFDNHGVSAGVAQGGVIDTVDGKWYGFLFQDHGAVGRTPVLTDCTWKDGWPMLGKDGDGRTVEAVMNLPAVESDAKPIIKSDEFDIDDASVSKVASDTDQSTEHSGQDDGKEGKLDLVWQWNHNPDNDNWSLTARRGWLRLTTGEKASGILHARNTLTQRTYGPTCSGEIKIDVSNMNIGDVAGLAAFSYNYGYIAVTKENSSMKLVMVDASSNAAKGKDDPQVIAAADCTGSIVYLKEDFNFAGEADGANKDTVSFYYSFDGSCWTKLGNTIQLSYELTHFMGSRFALFNYATKSAGGYVDFDYFRVSDEIMGES